MPTVIGFEHVIGYKSQRDGISFQAFIKTKISVVTMPGAAIGMQDAGHGADSAAAVDLSRLLHLRRDGEERAQRSQMANA